MQQLVLAPVPAVRGRIREVLGAVQLHRHTRIGASAHRRSTSRVPNPSNAIGSATLRRKRPLVSASVSRHGGVPSEQRPALIARFRDDPDCRVFLSTDAGSTGLNLQHACTLINMDLPWNPAVLAQRIARVYRMGQKYPVQIINYVAKGTIEEGMLSVHAFKRSLSAGILDGASAEVSLGGSRLNRFMNDVEKVTGRMGDGEAMAPAEEAVQVAAALNAPDDGAAGTHPWVERDSVTGARSLKVPLPSQETGRRIADALALLSDALLGAGGKNHKP